MSLRSAPLITYPSLLGDDGLCNDLEVVHVEHVLERWARIHESQSAFFFLSNLFNDLGDSACIDGAEAGNTDIECAAVSNDRGDILLFNRKVCSDGVRWVNGLIRLTTVSRERIQQRK